VRCTEIPLLEHIIYSAEDAKNKWNLRKEKKELPYDRQKPINLNILRGISNDWCAILRMQCRPCHVCKEGVMNAEHLGEKHLISITSYKQIWEGIKTFLERQLRILQRSKKTLRKWPKREIFIKYWSPILKEIREQMEEKYRSLVEAKEKP